MQALVLVGHGSHLDPGSAAPVYDHADRLRRLGPFDEVRTAFWKEEPSPREVLRTVESDDVYVIPVFASEGYFVDRVVPRELGLRTEREEVTARDVHYTPPVGTHPALTEVVRSRVDRVRRETARSELGVALVGHGTDRHAASGASTRDHAEHLDDDRFAEVRALFLDEAPHVGDLFDHLEADEIVVVPLFVSDGNHTTEDIPHAIGGSAARPSGVPIEVDGRRVHLTGAVGTDPRLVDVILERAREAGADTDGRSRTRPIGRAERQFLDWVAEWDGRTWGELLLGTGGGHPEHPFEIRHRADRGRPLDELDRVDGREEVRSLARRDADGRYRPLRGSSIRDGWVCSDLTERAFLDAVELFYPAAIENWYRERTGRLDVTHFRATADRQTSRYDAVSELAGEDLSNATEACCDDSVCHKRRVWEESADEAIDGPTGLGAIPCREPCSLFVEAAREFVRAAEDGLEDESGLSPGEREKYDELAAAIADGRVDDRPPGDVSYAGNRRWIRYLRAKTTGDVSTGHPPSRRPRPAGGQ